MNNTLLPVLAPESVRRAYRRNITTQKMEERARRTHESWVTESSMALRKMRRLASAVNRVLDSVAPCYEGKPATRIAASSSATVVVDEATVSSGDFPTSVNIALSNQRHTTADFLYRLLDNLQNAPDKANSILYAFAKKAKRETGDETLRISLELRARSAYAAKKDKRQSYVVVLWRRDVDVDADEDGCYCVETETPCTMSATHRGARAAVTDAVLLASRELNVRVREEQFLLGMAVIDDETALQVRPLSMCLPAEPATEDDSLVPMF